MREDIEGIEIGLEWDLVIETLIDFNSGNFVIDEESGRIKINTISHELKICFERIKKNQISNITEREFILLLEAFSNTINKLNKIDQNNTAFIMDCYTYSGDMIFLRKKFNLFDETKFFYLSDTLFELKLLNYQKGKTQDEDDEDYNI